MKATLAYRGRLSAAAALLLLLLLGLQGCSKLEQAVSKRQPSRPTASTPTDPAELALANMVSAVSSGKPTENLKLKFELRSRPIVAQPVDIDLALITGQDLDRIYATFQASDGLEITAGGKTDEVDRPPVGVPIRHTVTVVPRREGIFSVSAVVLSDSSNESVTRTFAIPVIAGSGVPAPDMAAAPVAASAPNRVRGR